MLHDHQHVEYFLQSRFLSRLQVKKLETRLQLDPFDEQSRLLLVGYFLRRRETNARKRYQEHVLWIIANRPTAEFAIRFFVRLDARLDGEKYQEGKKLWLDHIANNLADVRLLDHAAEYCRIYDRELSIKLLTRASELEPDNGEWLERLAFLNELDQSIELDPHDGELWAGATFQDKLRVWWAAGLCWLHVRFLHL